MTRMGYRNQFEDDSGAAYKMINFPGALCGVWPKSEYSKQPQAYYVVRLK